MGGTLLGALWLRHTNRHFRRTKFGFFFNSVTFRPRGYGAEGQTGTHTHTHTHTNARRRVRACGVDARCRLRAATLLPEFVCHYMYRRVELRGTWLANPQRRELQHQAWRAGVFYCGGTAVGVKDAVRSIDSMRGKTSRRRTQTRSGSTQRDSAPPSPWPSTSTRRPRARPQHEVHDRPRPPPCQHRDQIIRVIAALASRMSLVS